MIHQLATAVSCLLLAPSLMADVLVVGPAPAPYATISSAISAAAPGDTVLVRPGTYTGTFWVNRGVHLVGDGPGSPQIRGDVNMVVSGLHEDLSLANFKIDGRLSVRGWRGAALFQDLHFNPSSRNPLGSIGAPTASVRDCDRVVFQSCLIEGRDGVSTIDEGAPGDYGLRVMNSDVALYACRIIGGEGGDQQQSHYSAFGGGRGGDGLQVLGGTAWTGGSVSVGGAGGLDPFSGAYAATGRSLSLSLGGQHADSLHARFYFHLPSLSRAGETPELVVHGLPGDPILALVALNSGWRDLGALVGVLHLPNAFTIIPLGTIPASGTLHVPFPTFALGGASDDRRQVQLFASGSQGRMLSDPRSWSVVDAQY